MKTTIKLSAGRALVVAPTPAGVRVDLTLAGVVMAGEVLTMDQVGVLLHGLEAAAAKVEGRTPASEGIASARRINAPRASCASSGCNYPEGECSGALGGCLGLRRAA